MTIDRSKLQFYSNDPIDKIVHKGTATIVNPGALSGVRNRPDLRGVQFVTANPYGRTALARFRWSVDGGATWNGMDSQMAFDLTVDNRLNGSSVGTSKMVSLRALVSVGTDDNNIYINTISQYHTNSGFWTNIVTPSYLDYWGGWTAISQTFLVEYWLYERQ